ncbi:MAG: hypothetical protein A2Z91_00135 [Deltaproteobacteria bacterium GWA2_38_16]|nr:MAG: hypothetical protein A2Z91_00135 [Deltaproteobacteria bacterium GWA2_38_16]OGQ03514.1 MAG: hypothetical protein A3D19_01540 [Deltaproteobacteria bacterium RIFCSPHIGHO2_02_FULL_38_15]HBQ21250.1 RluA family pseudouridine synthase [Deltaproteobacteria bacterium]
MRTEFLKVTQEEAGQRLDAYLLSKGYLPSRAQIQRLIQGEKVRVNGFPSKSSYLIKEKDTITVEIPAPTESVMVAQDLPLHVYYEDEDLIVINKAAGMVVHPGAGNKEGTLVNALLHHCKHLSSIGAGIGGVLRPGIVHRLDRDTSGLMVVAKTDQAHLSLSDQFKERTIRRHYETLVYGRMETPHGSFDSPIGRHPTQRKKMSSQSKRGKSALTVWEVLKAYDQVSLMKATLATGRTHQIRVHFSEGGHPVLGDETYGGKNRVKHIVDQKLKHAIEQLPYLLLHAKTIAFTHPKTHEILSFEAPIPDYFKHILEILDDSQ